MYRTFWLLTLSLLLPSAVFAEKPEVMRFVYTRPPDHAVTRWLILVYTEAFRRMDIRFEFISVPPKRASLYSSLGKADGELGRVYVYNEKYPMMVRVEERHALIVFAAFSHNKALKLDGWDSLEGTTYKVCYRRGIKKAETQLNRVLTNGKLYQAKTVAQGIKMLESGSRIDFYIDIENAVTGEIESETRPVPIYMAGVMEKTTGHAFLHERHAELAPELSQHLREMKQAGLFDEYLRQVNLSRSDISW